MVKFDFSCPCEETFPCFYQLRFGHPCDETKRFDITQYVRQQLGPFYPKTSVWGDPCPGVEKILVILILPCGVKRIPVKASFLFWKKKKRRVFFGRCVPC